MARAPSSPRGQAPCCGLPPGTRHVCERLRTHVNSGLAVRPLLGEGVALAGAASVPDKSPCVFPEGQGSERRGPWSAPSAHKGPPCQPARDPRGRHVWPGRAHAPNDKGQRPSQALVLERGASPCRRQPVLSSRGLHLQDGPSQSRHRLMGLVTCCARCLPGKRFSINSRSRWNRGRQCRPPCPCPIQRPCSAQASSKPRSCPGQTGAPRSVMANR